MGSPSSSFSLSAWRPAAGALTLAVALTACGGADTDTSADAAQGEPTADATTDEALAAAEPAANLTDGCVEDYDPDVDYFPDEVGFEHATGVSVSYTDHTKRVEITRPWKGATGERVTVLLVQCGTPTPDEVEADHVVEVPIESAATFSTTHLPPLAAFGRTDVLAAHGGLQYASTPEVLDAADAGEVVEVGDQSSPDVETLVAAEPQVAFTSAGISGDEQRQALLEVDVTAIPNADWLEETALGRSEWLKFMALFLNEEAAANDLFDEVATNVEKVRARAAEAAEATDEPPTVLSQMPFEGVWYMPAGESFKAAALEQLGANYPWSDTEGTGALELDFEEVLDRAALADVWIDAGSVRGTFDDLAQTDERFAEFRAFREREVYANDRATNPNGQGNDLFERGAMRPDLVLADLFKVLYPDRADDVEFTFYGRVGELAGS